MNIKIAALGFSLLLGSLNTQAFQLHDVVSIKDLSLEKKAGLALIAGGIAFFGYKLVQFVYNYSKNYAEDKIVNTITDNIILAGTTNFTINGWPVEKQKQALFQKARLINMRKRVFEKLEKKVSESLLSTEHRRILEDNMYDARALFQTIDLLRKKNPYEQEYSSPSFIDTIIENKIVDSIMLSLKPNEHCTQAELKTKKAMEQRRTKVLNQLRSKLGEIYLEKLLKSSIYFSMFLATL